MVILSEDSSQKAIRFHISSYHRRSRCRYCACAGFLIATPGVIRNPSLGIDFILKDDPSHHHHGATRAEAADLREHHPSRRRNCIHSGN